MAAIGYPVHVRARIDPQLSRWLWLVKMFLAMPHFLVLTALLAAMIVSSLFAAAAILITGRYPRALFRFNTGVLRWNWRVGFYVYAALGTDRYPPFSLEQPDYPADLEVDYPERLSRPLVLAKWFLAIPHLIVVGLLIGVIMLYPWDAFASWSDGTHPIGGYSVLNLLVVLAGFFLLITGHYPRPFGLFLVGISRWIYRVVAYLAFMTDEYPPFRLDAGER